jgi:hypothetical protein
MRVSSDMRERSYRLAVDKLAVSHNDSADVIAMSLGAFARPQLR